MDKKIIISLVSIFLIGGAASFYLISNRAGTTPQTKQQSGAETQNTTSQQSLKDLLSSTRAQECSFSDSSGNAGTIFVDNNKMRGDFTIEGNQSVKSHMIIDGQTTYIWIEGQSNGLKTSFNASGQTQTSDTQITNKDNTVDMDKKAGYNCKNWTVNPSVFSLPSGVEFSETNNGPGETTDKQSTPSTQCAACDSLTGDAKTQCRAALKCS